MTQSFEPIVPLADGATAPLASSAQPRPSGVVGLVGVVAALLLLVAGLWWAKWAPYAQKTQTLAETGVWTGSSVFGDGRKASATPSLAGTWSFTRTYVAAVWKAAVVGLVVAAALEALVPRRWLVALLSRRNAFGQGAMGAVLSLPSMMCTCCTSPVAIGLRRRGAPVGATVAYWLGNPVLNPAVLVFLALTLPSRLVLVRAVVGVVLVLAAAVVATKVASGRGVVPTTSRPDVGGRRGSWLRPGTDTPDAVSVRELPRRFFTSLGRYLVVLVPEYLALVLLTGWLSGWLADFAGLGQTAGPVALVLVALVGAALVIPTGGEIPVVAGLIQVGASIGAVGALLITLPALSLPSIVMVARSFSWPVTAAVTLVVVAAGVLAGVLLAASPGL